MAKIDRTSEIAYILARNDIIIDYIRNTKHTRKERAKSIDNLVKNINDNIVNKTSKQFIEEICKLTCV